MADILKKIGQAAKDTADKVRGIPPGDSEVQGIKAASDQIDALKAQPNTEQAAPASTVPDPTEEEKANPLTRYGAKPGEKRLDTSYLDQPSAVKAPVYDDGGDVSFGSKLGSYAQGTLSKLGAMNKPDEKKPAAAPTEDSGQDPLTEAVSGIKNYVADKRVTTGRGNNVMQPSYTQGSAPASAAPAMPLIPMGQPPVLNYDEGGEVKPEYKSRYKEAESVENRPKVGFPKIYMEKDPLGEPAFDESVNYSNSKEEASKPTGAMPHLDRQLMEPGSKPLPHGTIYDEGGEPDVNDGKHQVAVLQEGERVLTPEQNEQYKAEHPEVAKVEPTAQPADTLKLKPYGQVVEDKAKAKAAEMVSNPNPTGQPSTSSVEGQVPERNMAEEPTEEKPKTTYGHILAENWLKSNGMNIDAMKAPKELNQGSQGVPNVENGMTAPAALGQPKPAPAQGPMKPMALPEAQAGPTQAGPAPVGKAAYQAKMKAYDTAYMDAMHKAAQTNDPQYREQAGRIKEEQLTYQQQHPAGSPESAHPGILGKIGHVANEVAGRARTAAIDLGATPASDKVYGLAAKQAAAEGQVKEAAAQNAAENKADKTANGPDWKLNANVVGPNGRAVLENSKTGETKEAPEGYTAYDKPEHIGDQGTYIAQWYKDHPDAPKSATNDDKAIEAYGAAKAAAGQENKAKGKIYYYDTPNGRQGYTYGEAQTAGLKPEDGYAVSALQAEKDRKSNDTYEGLKGQMEQYKQNIAKAAGQLLPNDVEKMSSVVESVESPDYVSKIVGGLWDDVSAKPLTGYNEKVMKGALTKSAYDAMSPTARQLVADYFTTLLAHFGNVKATLGQVPRNEKLITTEMNMIPKPYLNAAEAEPAFTNYAAQVERNNAHNVRFGNQKAEAATQPNAPAENNQGFQMTGEEKKLAGSISMPDGSHPAFVHKDPVNGKVLVFSGKAGDPWVDPTTGQAVK
jgi:hypothetical protein